MCLIYIVQQHHYLYINWQISKFMFKLLRIKKLIIKLLTCFIFPEKLRKNVRNFLFYFSFVDFVRFKRQNFHIISLGSDCLPRVLTTAVKLKPRKIYGEKTLPFDLCRSYDLKKIIKFLQLQNKNNKKTNCMGIVLLVRYSNSNCNHSKCTNLNL